MTVALPKLKESQVSALATPQSWQKGKQYFRHGAIADPMRQNHQLWADCEGSVLYHTKATLGTQGIESSSCTCPYDWGGICKHQVALLLTYIHRPESFQEIQPLEKLLANRSRDELLQIIERMLQRHPDLLSVVDAPKMPTLGQMLDLAKYQRQAERVLQGDEMHSMAAGLESLADHGGRFCQSGDWLNAGDVYQQLLETANEYYDYAVFDIDYNGEVACVIQDVAAGLQNSLANSENLDAERRQRWVETLFNAFMKDIELGGIDYGYPAGDALVNYTLDEDWVWLEPRIQNELNKSPRNLHSDWDRRCLVNLLTAWAKQRGNHQQAEATILDFGTPEQKAFLQLEQRNFDEAITIARSHFQGLPGLVVRFADALVQADEPQQAEAFVKEFAQDGGYGYQDWLAQFYQTHGQTEQFIEAQLELLKTRFSVARYQKLQAKAEPLGNWPTLRQSLLTDLEAKERHTELIDLALLEQEWSGALYHLKQLPKWSRTSYQKRVADTIQVDQPGTAIALYQELIEAAINQRGRDNYRRAAEYLQTTQTLYAQLEREDEFQAYLEQVRSRHKRLPALQQELSNAGL